MSFDRDNADFLKALVELTPRDLLNQITAIFEFSGADRNQTLDLLNAIRYPDLLRERLPHKRKPGLGYPSRAFFEQIERS